MILMLLACLPDDVDDTAFTGQDTDSGSPTDTTETGTTTPEGIFGKWVSEGEDLSDLFAPYYESLDGNFKSSFEYVVSAHDLGGSDARYEGTFTIDESTTPASIVLSQSMPYMATASGIYQIDGDVMTYEVVQTEPDYGYVPPTPESGFGSTSGPEIQTGDNVQTYRRTE